MTDELKSLTLLGGATVVHDARGNAYPARQVEKAFAEQAQMLDPRNSDPGFEEKQRAAQELMSRQHHEARRAMQDARGRTLEQHAVYLSTFGTGDADYMAKRAYMLEHGLEYTNGTLGYTPSTVHREAAWEANQRSRMNLETYLDLTQRRAQEEAAIMAERASERPLATSSGRVDGIFRAQTPRAPGKIFSRSDILAILRADRARYMAGLRITPVPDCPAEATVVNDLITVFENLE